MLLSKIFMHLHASTSSLRLEGAAVSNTSAYDIGFSVLASLNSMSNEGTLLLGPSSSPELRHDSEFFSRWAMVRLGVAGKCRSTVELHSRLDHERNVAACAQKLHDLLSLPR
jgi:hypothetical protein